MDNAEQVALLYEIQKMQFVTVELNLYLDTHPADENALSAYNDAAKQLLQLKNDYENQYGPLMNFGWGGESQNPWRWIEEPWPWER